MKRSLVLKLLPVTLMAAIGLFLAAKAPPQANAAVSGISPSSFVVNAGSPVSFSLIANPGPVTISSSSSATAFINASCSGCTVTGNGTSSVVVTVPSTSLSITIGFTLDVACTTSGLPISVVATQGNQSAANGVTGTCSCNYSVYGNCGCAAYSTLNCGCGTYAYSTLACGCGTYASTTCGCGTYAYAATACGCGTYGYASTACGCGTYGYGTTTAPVYINGVLVTNGVYGNGVYGNPYGNNCGVCTTTGLLANCAVGTSQVSVTVPGTAVCGSRINVLVTVRNSIGGIANDGSQVSVTSNMGALTPNVTVTSGGIASTSLLLAPSGAGTATISASSNGVNGAASINVTCTAAPAPVIVAPAPVPPVVYPQLPIISAPNAGDGGCLAKGGCN